MRKKELIKNTKHVLLSSSGVWLGFQKYIFAPPPTKTAKFEVKNSRKSVLEEAKAKHIPVCYFCYFSK